MASVVTRRLLGPGLSKLRPCFSHNRCASVFLLKVNQDHGLFHNQKLPLMLTTNTTLRFYSQQDKNEDKPSLFQRFKQMYKEYWYILVPVHLVTSAAWFGGFYYLAKSGVDISALLESLHLSEKITRPLKDSSMGYIAVAYALYKIATPARYTVTLGGTTISINYLKKWGYIKPIPSTERLKEMIHEQKDHLLETMRDTRDGLKMQSEKLKDKKDDIIQDLDKSVKDLSEKIKSKEHIVEGGVKKKRKDCKDKY